MLAENLTDEEVKVYKETLKSFIEKDNDYKISHLAKFTSFKHRSKVEFLRFFIV